MDTSRISNSPYTPYDVQPQEYLNPSAHNSYSTHSNRNYGIVTASPQAHRSPRFDESGLTRSAKPIQGILRHPYGTPSAGPRKAVIFLDNRGLVDNQGLGIASYRTPSYQHEQPDVAQSSPPRRILSDPSASLPSQYFQMATSVPGFGVPQILIHV